MQHVTEKQWHVRVYLILHVLWDSNMKDRDVQLYSSILLNYLVN